MGVATIPVSKAGAVANGTCCVGPLLRNDEHGLEPFNLVFLLCFRQPDSCGSMSAVDSTSTNRKLPRLYGPTSDEWIRPTSALDRRPCDGWPAAARNFVGIGIAVDSARLFLLLQNHEHLVTDLASNLQGLCHVGSCSPLDEYRQI